jgi:hypothetical protein
MRPFFIYVARLPKKTYVTDSQPKRLVALALGESFQAAKRTVFDTDKKAVQVCETGNPV